MLKKTLTMTALCMIEKAITNRIPIKCNLLLILYLFLFKTAEEETRNALMETNVYSGDGIFDIMYNGLLVKANMMRKYPDMRNFF